MTTKDTGGSALRYMAWDRGYYESDARIFPHPHEVHGPFMATSEDDLIAQLKAHGIDPEAVRWEVSPLAARNAEES